MIQNIEELRPELYIEVLRNPFDVIVLKQREIQVRGPRPDQNIAAGIAPQIQALAERRIANSAGAECRVRAAQRRRSDRGEERGRRRRNREALGLDVVVGISGIDKRIAPWAQ